MRQLTTALSNHIAQELTSLVACVAITRNDGVVLRMTESDQSITVGGEVYEAGATFNLSALKSSSDLSVDNATMDVGIDGQRFKRSDFDKDLLRRASVRVFLVNWQAPDDGTIELKTGWIGDVTRRDTDFVTLAIRGLTQALQRNILSQYSPTCRADFGDAKCGHTITPLQVRRSGAEYKIGDTFTDHSATVTHVALENPSFELANTSGWDEGGSWTVDYSAARGYYATSASYGTLSFDMIATVTGMSATEIDAGSFALFFRMLINGSGYVRLSCYDGTGRELGATNSAKVSNTNGVRWEEAVASMFVPPQTRSIRATVYVDAGGSVDDAKLDYASSFNNKVYKVKRIPTRSNTEAVSVANYRFADGLNGWSGIEDFEVVSSDGAVRPVDGAYFVGVTSSNTAVALTQDVTIAGIEGKLVELSAYRNDLGATSTTGISLAFLDASSGVLSTVDTGLSHGLTREWEKLRVSDIAPTGTKAVRITLYASDTIVPYSAFDSVRLFTFSLATASSQDNRRGRSADSTPAFGTVTYDGDLILEELNAPYGFDAVSAVNDRRVFAGTTIDGTQYAFFAGRITWLSGANAGSVSFVRTWVSGTKTIKLYNNTGDAIVNGDKFMWSYGCNKTESDCKNRFSNLVNFRGEPYLPGTEKALTFFTGVTNG